MSKKFVRGANYGEEEKLLLLNIVQSYIAVVENKKTDAVTGKEKERAWEMIAIDYNAKCGKAFRSTSSLKVCYENIKKTARKVEADKKVEIFKTGGGKASTLNVTPLHERVLSMMPGTATPLQARFDSDATYNGFIDSARASASSSPALPSDILNSHDPTIPYALSSPTPILVTTTHDEPAPLNDGHDLPIIEVIEENTDLPVLDWSQYSVKMIHTPPHPSLKVLPSASTTTTNKQTKKQTTARRRPSLAKSAWSETSKQYATLAEAKLELVQIQIDMLKVESERIRIDLEKKKDREEEDYERKKIREEEEYEKKKIRDGEEYEKKKIRDEEELARQRTREDETYERKTRQEEAEAEVRLEILKIELRTKQRLFANLPST